MIRFYAPDIAENAVLPEVESGHAVRVLRHRPGDLLEVVDGKGHLYSCRLLSSDARNAAVAIEDCADLPKVWAPAVTLAVAPTKNMDRMEWLVEKLVEIGIDRIVPLRCERSERRELKPERLIKIAVSAMKQSLKAVLPVLEATTPLPVFLRGLPEAGADQRFVAWCDENSPRQLLARACAPGCDTTILIGPEGDFSPAEVQASLEKGFQPVSLGDNRLRTETAALVAVDTFHIINQLHS